MNHAEGPYIQIGRCHHFTHVGQALQHLFDAVLAQGEHADGERGVPDVRGRCPVADVLANGFVTHRQLVDAQAAVVAVVAVAFAFGAAYGAPHAQLTLGAAVLLAPASDLRLARLGSVVGATLQVL